MTERWVKTGLLLDAPTPQPWAVSHAALPVAHAVDETGFDLLYSARDAGNRAHVGRSRVAVESGALRISGHDEAPVLAPGTPGAFDDCGVTTSCVVDAPDGRTLLFYTGWTLTRVVPFLFHIGLAVSDDGGRTFTRTSLAPVLGRTAVDPYLTASPCVMLDEGTWRMWYVSCERWETVGDELRHRYHLRYAESADGVAWTPTGRVVVDFAGGEEYAIARPHVVREDGRYRMWFCARGDAYRLGYAESADGLVWDRDDGVIGLTPDAGAFDAEMLAYPHVVDVAGERHLLYNGDGYGRTGIGAAVARKDA